VSDAVAWGLVVYVGPDGTVEWVRPIGGPGRPDLATVDALARWQIRAGRAGGSIGLQEVCEPLALLLRLVGLAEAVGLPETGRPCDGQSGEEP
jgi:hypothetical protein